MHRVIQWGTGNVGRHSLRGILERPDLQLVGLRVYSDDKAGVDAGEMLGGAPVGVAATTDRATILDLEADCVLYNALGTTLVSLEQPTNDIVDLLASGKNVIASAVDLFLYVKPGVAPQFLTAEVIGRINDACQAGGTTFYAAGMTPGFALDLWPITMTRVCRRVDHLKVTEVVNLRDYRSTMMAFMGFGLPADADVPMYRLFEDTMNSPYAAALALVGDALGVAIDDVQYRREVATTPTEVVLPSGTFAPGTVVATRFEFVGYARGDAVATIEYVWRVSDDVRPDWPTGHCLWRLEIDGDPSVRSEMVFATETDAKRPTSITVAMHGLNAIPAVCAAPPGIATHLTLPVFGGRAAAALKSRV